MFSRSVITADLDFERRAGDSALADDRQKRTDLQLGVVWDWDRDGSYFGSALHHNVTAASSNFDKAVLFKYSADLSP